MKVSECKELMHQQVNKAVDDMIDTFTLQLRTNGKEFSEEDEWKLFESVIKNCSSMLASSIQQITEQIKVNMNDKDFMDKVFKETGVSVNE